MADQYELIIRHFAIYRKRYEIIKYVAKILSLSGRCIIVVFLELNRFLKFPPAGP